MSSSSTSGAAAAAAAAAASLPPPPLPVKTRKNGASLGMPSPTGSTSETSDYQRSTPSPREDQATLIGEDPNPIKYTRSCHDLIKPCLYVGSLDDWPAPPSAATDSQRDPDDAGFSEPTAPGRKAESDPRLTLQQVRVALEKMPGAAKSDCGGGRAQRYLKPYIPSNS